VDNHTPALSDGVKALSSDELDGVLRRARHALIDLSAGVPTCTRQRSKREASWRHRMNPLEGSGAGSRCHGRVGAPRL
jgi:hypothetical protein